jgi:glucose-6-phosphate 1-epimerase
MTDINELNHKYGTAGRIAFRVSPHGLPEVVLVNGYGSCEISLYGGQVVNYRPMGHAPALFMSTESFHEAGKQIRGGIPLCWPWFGPPPAEGLPRHGFARLLYWEVLSTSYDSKCSEITIGVQDTDSSREMWPHRFELVQKITLTDNLSIELSTFNRGEDPFEVSQSIHPYFKVRDINRVSVNGLEDITYTDLFTKEKRSRNDPLRINAETYYIYDAEDHEFAIRDEGLNRDILMTYKGMNKLVVWNPWKEKAGKLPEFGDDEYTGMITAAPAVLAEDATLVEPGEKITVKAAVQVVLV